MNGITQDVGLKKVDKLIVGAFIFVLVLHVIFSFDRWEYFGPLVITKALLMPILLVWLLMVKISHRDPLAMDKVKMRSLTLSALFFAWVGDTALLFEHLELWIFMLGLSSFLIAHICYAWSFTIRFGKGHDIRYLKQHPWLIFVAAAYALAIFLMVSSNLGEMLVPVLIYILVILAMLLTALDRGGAVSKVAFRYALAGAILFSLSDSLVAYAKFVESVPYAEAVIMLLYGMAQLSIIYGTKRMLEINE